MYETLAPLGSIPDYTATVLLAAYFSPDTTESRASILGAARSTLSRGLDLSPQTLARLSGPRNVRDTLFTDGIQPPTVSLPTITLSAIKLPQVPPTARRPEPPRQAAMTATTATATPAARSAPTATPQADRKPGRGNLLNIVQDWWRK